MLEEKLTSKFVEVQDRGLVCWNDGWSLPSLDLTARGIVLRNSSNVGPSFFSSNRMDSRSIGLSTTVSGFWTGMPKDSRVKLICAYYAAAALGRGYEPQHKLFRGGWGHRNPPSARIWIHWSSRTNRFPLFCRLQIELSPALALIPAKCRTWSLIRQCRSSIHMYCISYFSVVYISRK